MSRRDLASVFQGKNCVVTGVTGDIGFAVARLLAQSGANILGQSTGRDPANDERCHLELRALTNRDEQLIITYDLSKLRACKALVSHAYARFPTVDHMFFCHGFRIGEDAVIAGMIPRRQSSRIQMKINYIAIDEICSSVFARQRALPRNTQGISMRISAITSTAALGSRGGDIDYAASKGAAQAALISRRKTGLALGIRVSVVAPGPVVGQMTDGRGYRPSEVMAPMTLAEKILTVHAPEFDRRLGGAAILIRNVGNKLRCSRISERRIDLRLRSIGDA